MIFRKVAFFLIGISLIFSGCGSSAEKKAEDILLNSMQTVDNIFAAELLRLKNIALENEVQKGDWEFIKAALLAETSDMIPALYWYALPDGSYFTSEQDSVDADLSNREYFPDLQAGKEVVGFPIVGKTSGKKSIVVAVPILKEETVTGILGTSIYLDELWDFLKEKIVIPEKYDFYAVSTSGITMFDLETKDHLLDNVLEQTSESLVNAIKTIISSEEGKVVYVWNEKDKIAVYRTSPVTGWRYVISYY